MSSMQNFPFFFVLIMMVHSIETARINERHLQVKYKYCAYTYYMYHDSPTAFKWERKNRERARGEKRIFDQAPVIAVVDIARTLKREKNAKSESACG